MKINLENIVSLRVYDKEINFYDILYRKNTLGMRDFVFRHDLWKMNRDNDIVCVFNGRTMTLDEYLFFLPCHRLYGNLIYDIPKVRVYISANTYIDVYFETVKKANKYIKDRKVIDTNDKDVVFHKVGLIRGKRTINKD